MQDETVKAADRTLTFENRRRSCGKKTVIVGNSSVADIEKVVRRMVSLSRAVGFFVAADNLKHYLDKNEQPRLKTLSRRWLRSFTLVKNAERKNQSRFEKDILKAIENKKTGCSDYWDANIICEPGFGDEELFFASGKSVLTSFGSFTITYTEDGIAKIKGSASHWWHDNYDFHDGWGVYIPGFGYIPDAAMRKLVTQGNAGEYPMGCTWTQELTAELNTNDWFPKAEWYWKITI